MRSLKLMNRMGVKQLICVLCLLSSWKDGRGEENMEDFFSLSPAELANIQVTIATGTAKPIFRSAAVTSVITAEQITEMGATELHEVLDTVPGLHVSIQPVTNDYVYTMRGIANGTNSEVLLMMNGSRFSLPYKGSHMTGMQIPVEAIQRIEVIRGPGSALYGADAFAGVINIITKKADDIDGTVIGGRGGSWGTRSTWGQVGQRWNGWDVAASLQYSSNDVDEDRIIKADALSDSQPQVSNAPGAMQTQWERWNAHLNLQRKYVDMNFWAYSEGDAGLRAGAGGTLDKRGRLDGENYMGDVRLSTEDALTDWEFELHVSYLSTAIETQIYNFPIGSVLPIGDDGHLNPESNRLVFFPDGMRTNLGIEQRMPIVEFSSLFKGFDGHLLRFIAGYRYEEVSTTESRNYGPGVIDGTTLIPRPAINIAGDMVDVTGTQFTFLSDRHRDIWSFALQDEWQFADGWQLTAGIRYDEYSDFGSTFNPRAALVWDVNEQLTTKLLYGQAYRAPSFLQQYQQNSQSRVFIGNPGLEPEEIETVELAFDYRPVDSLRTTLNVFYYRIENMVGGETAPDDTSIQVENGKGQEGYGTEFEWDWQFHENWHFRGNYAWQYARNKETHRRVSGVPEHKLYSALAWKFMHRWQLQTQLNWVGHRVSPLGDSRTLDDYETVDITLNGSKLFGYVDVTASVRNLFDSDGKEPAISVYPDSMPIPGQSFYFEASVHF